MLKSINGMFMKPKWIFFVFGLVNCAIIASYFSNVGVPDWGILQYIVAIVVGPVAILFGVVGLLKVN